MNNLLRLYSNHADAPDIPNGYSLQRLLDRRIVFMKRGKLRYEHIYEVSRLLETTLDGIDPAEFDYQTTIDHGEESV